MADDTRVAVLGTGIMGAAMARNLLSAGVPVTVWDRSAAATAALSDAGAVVARSAAVDLAVSAAPGATLPLLEALSRQWRATVDAGHGREDVSAPPGWGSRAPTTAPGPSLSPVQARNTSSVGHVLRKLWRNA